MGPRPHAEPGPLRLRARRGPNGRLLAHLARASHPYRRSLGRGRPPRPGPRRCPPFATPRGDRPRDVPERGGRRPGPRAAVHSPAARERTGREAEGELKPSPLGRGPPPRALGPFGTGRVRG